MKVEFCLFDENGEWEIEWVEFLEYIDEVWYGYLLDVWLGMIYGYCVYGFYEFMAGYWFNFYKFLFDFYVR